MDALGPLYRSAQTRVSASDLLTSECSMKAFLLAAGHGTRLRPITDNLPKCLVPIQGVPMLAIWLSVCKELGISEVLINLHAHADSVSAFLRQNHHSGVRVHVSEEKQLLGSAGTLRANRDWVQKENLSGFSTQMFSIVPTSRTCCGCIVSTEWQRRLESTKFRIQRAAGL